MLVYSCILIIGVSFVLINEAAKPIAKSPGKAAAGKQKRPNTHATTTEAPKNKSHKSVKNNGSRKFNRTIPPFRLYQISNKTSFTLKPWNENENGKLENGTMTFYNRLEQAVTIYEFKHYIYKNDEPIYSEKFKNIVIQRARLTGDLTFRYHDGGDPSFTDYWTIFYINKGQNLTTTKERCLYNVGSGPGAILLISFQKHLSQPARINFRRVGLNEGTFSIREV